jgi:4-hydroxybenzoate polyprenyltransferase
MSRGSRTPALLRLLRPRQWTKNLACLTGAIFGGRLAQTDAVLLDVVVMVVFVLASSAAYVVNDVTDLLHDREHPRKRLRPLASGEIAVRTALLVAAGLAVSSLIVASRLNTATFACVAVYLTSSFLYSLWLKRVALLDVALIASGYVLRVLASIYVLRDVPTAWIVLCTYFLALFIAISKRRAELSLEASSGRSHRPVLRDYSLELVDAMLDSSATMTVMSYALFTATSGKNPSLILTVPIVYYATMHYRRLALMEGLGAEPEHVFLTDRTIQVSVVLWLACFVAIFYGELHLFR